MRIQKQPHRNYLTKRPDSSIPYNTYYVEEHHRAIVTRELWEKVQARLDAKQKEVEKGLYRTSKSHFLFGRVFCGECGEQMRRITYGVNKSRRKVWKCHGRTKRNGCENDVINEDELFEKVASEAGVGWNGVENMKGEEYASIKQVMVYADGRVTVR